MEPDDAAFYSPGPARPQTGRGVRETAAQPERGSVSFALSTNCRN